MSYQLAATILESTHPAVLSKKKIGKCILRVTMLGVKEKQVWTKIIAKFSREKSGALMLITVHKMYNKIKIHSTFMKTSFIVSFSKQHTIELVLLL